MTPVHIRADWNDDTQMMTVAIRFDGQTYAEAMDGSAWRSYARDLWDGKEPRVGGLKLKINAKPGQWWEVTNAIREYLLRVDEAFRCTGGTNGLAPALLDDEHVLRYAGVPFEWQRQAAEIDRKRLADYIRRTWWRYTNEPELETLTQRILESR